MWSTSKLQSPQTTTIPQPKTSLDAALAAFTAGNPVLIHDDTAREDEVDLVYPAHGVTPRDVAALRNDAGGLICLALADEIAEQFSLPYLADAICHPAGTDVELGYDSRSSFSLTVNHRDTYTGITDKDRARTITALADAAADPGAVDFSTEFNTPGHLHLLRAAPGLLEDRRGHTELGIALAEFAEIPPAVVVCEMLDDVTGEALSRTKAARYAADNGLVFLDETEIIDAFYD